MKRTLILTWLLIVSPQLSDAGAMVYMPLGDADEIAVVDVEKNEVVSRIPGIVNSHGLAAAPDGSIIVAGSLTEISERVPDKPEAMSEAEHLSHHRPSDDTQRIEKPIGGILYVVGVSKGQILNKVIVPATVHHNAVTPIGRYALSTHPTAGMISVVDIDLGKVVRTVPTGSVPNYVAVSHGGSKVYVSNSGNDLVTEIDTKSWQITRQLKVKGSPAHMVFSPDGKYIHVVSAGDGKIRSINLKQGKVEHQYHVGEEAHGVAVSHDGKTLFASSKKENRLTRIDLTSGTRQEISLSPAPYHVAMIPGRELLYVSSRKKPIIWVIDPESLQILGEIELGHGAAHQMVSVEDE